MKTVPFVTLLVLLFAIPLGLQSQQPVIIGLHKIVTLDSTLVVNGNDSIYLNGTNFTNNPPARPFSLVTVDAQTGDFLSQNTVDNATGFGSELNAYNQIEQRYHFISINNQDLSLEFFHTVNAVSGSQSRVAVNPPFLFRELEYDALKQVFFTFREENNPNFTYSIGQINPQNGSYQPLGNVPGLASISSNRSTYDSNHGNFYLIGLDFTGDQYLYRINTDSMTVSQTPLPLSPEGTLYDLAYDVNLDRLFTIRSSSGNNLPVIFEINPGTGALDSIATLPDATTFTGGASYDFASGSYVVMLGASTIPAQHRIYTVQVTTGAVTGDTVINDRVYAWECDNSEFLQTKYGSATQINPAAPQGQVRAYPNPARDRLFLEWPDNRTGTYTLLNLNGQTVRQGEATGSNFIPVGSLPKGMYLLQTLSGDRSQTQKILLR